MTCSFAVALHRCTCELGTFDGHTQEDPEELEIIEKANKRVEKKAAGTADRGSDDEE